MLLAPAWRARTLAEPGGAGHGHAVRRRRPAAGARQPGRGRLRRRGRGSAVPERPCAQAKARTGSRCPACSRPAAKTAAHPATSSAPATATGALRRRGRRGAEAEPAWLPASGRDPVSEVIPGLRWC